MPVLEWQAGFKKSKCPTLVKWQQSDNHLSVPYPGWLPPKFPSCIPRTLKCMQVSESKPDCVSWQDILFSTVRILPTSLVLCLIGPLTLVLQLFGTLSHSHTQFVYISMTFMFLPVPGCLENTYPTSETKFKLMLWSFTWPSPLFWWTVCTHFSLAYT